ncbi:VOC family protein [Pseudobutyrivibrio xylanivorans]|nr:hypothetical protein [Pseudobutyrivibrio xylanivorans]
MLFEVIRENYRPQKEDWKLDLKVDNLAELKKGIKKDDENSSSFAAEGGT